MSTALPLSLRSLTCLFLLFSSLAMAEAPSPSTPLAPAPLLGNTAKEILENLETQHYSRVTFDDAMSARMLQEYLDNLDGGRLFFLASDIEAFSKYEYALDDRLRDSDVQPGFEIFNLYRKRAIDRLQKVVDTLPAALAAMDFSQQESIELDRRKAAWPATDAEADDLWRRQLKANALSLRLAGKQPEEIEKTLRKRYKTQLNRLKELNSEDAFEIYMNALAGLYDPHTSYLSPQRSENFNISMSLSLEGIGAVLERDEDYTKVVRLVPAGPADKGGQLKPADRIVGVGQGDSGEIVDVIGWRLDDVVDLIRGPKGSIVRLQVLPAKARDDSESRLIRIERNTVKLEDQSAKKDVLELWHEGKSHKVGIITIPAFYMDFEAMRRGDPNYKSTTRDVAKLLEELSREQVEGVIVDLRNNGGGSLREATLLTSLFIESGFTVQIRSANGRVERDAKPVGLPYYGGPLVVLIDRLSASASEIFAGAIQDYNRGLIVGAQSFGKGTVQSLLPLKHGDLKLTESKFYRISGESTQHRGVVPDIAFPTMYNPKEVGESALPTALPWDTINPVRHSEYYPVSSILDELLQRHETRIAKDPDFSYLNAQLDMRRQQAERTLLSLNESERRTQQTEEKQAELALENRRREAKGLKPLDTLEAPSNDAQEEDVGDAASDSEKKKAADDVFLTESAQILLDSVQLFRRVASRLN